MRRDEGVTSTSTYHVIPNEQSPIWSTNNLAISNNIDAGNKSSIKFSNQPILTDKSKILPIKEEDMNILSQEKSMIQNCKSIFYVLPNNKKYIQPLDINGLCITNTLETNENSVKIKSNYQSTADSSVLRKVSKECSFVMLHNKNIKNTQTKMRAKQNTITRKTINLLPHNETDMIDCLQVRSDIESISSLITSNMKQCKSEIMESKKNIIKSVVHSCHIADTIVKSKAILTIPEILILRQNQIYTRRCIAARTRFGPIQGIKMNIKSEEAKILIRSATVEHRPIFLHENSKDNSTDITFINVSDQEKSNWISLLPLGNKDSANIWLYEEENEIYIIVMNNLMPRIPLVLGYSVEYAKKYNLPDELPMLNFDEVLLGQRWWCQECARGYSTAQILEKHNRTYHKPKPLRRLRYRCKKFPQTFSRFYSLKRHINNNCIINEIRYTSTPSIPIPNVTPEKHNYLSQTLDENRLPSDESMQNFTSNLDISMNLFDPDKMPYLDISGGFTLDSEPMTDFFNNEPPKKSENILVSCKFCDQTIVKGKERQHARVCNARTENCECGKTFLSKEKLKEHIRTGHAIDTDKDKGTADEINQYACQKCPLMFKRRGMLVNHLWRIHQTLASTLPLQRRVKHYPCQAEGCTKMYMSKAKRDKHMKKHHHGVSLTQVNCIEVGSKRCSASACPHCPRQYATRAKMLQHIRRSHLNSVLPSNDDKEINVASLNHNNGGTLNNEEQKT